MKRRLGAVSGAMIDRAMKAVSPDVIKYVVFVGQQPDDNLHDRQVRKEIDAYLKRTVGGTR